MLKRGLLILLLLAGQPIAAIAQEETLADIRQQLTVLYVDIQRLRTELSTTGELTSGTSGSTPLDRLNAIESELQRLTSKTEELEFRINRITVDGTNRIGDLEFRLCELEAGCDIALLGDTPSLGGIDNLTAVPNSQDAPEPSIGPALAVGEEADFQRAQEALANGDFRRAADLLETFSAAYPGSPLAPRADFVRGQAFEGLGEMVGAARAYLTSFSADPTGAQAPEALYKLGFALGQLGQVNDACLTLAEVETRFPGNAILSNVETTMTNLGCS